MILSQPLVVVNRITQYDLMVTVNGGGLSGQAGAVRHGFGKALTYFEPDFRPLLKKGGSSPAIRAWSSARIRSPQGPRELPVLQALRRLYGNIRKKGGASRPFFVYRRAANFTRGWQAPSAG